MGSALWAGISGLNGSSKELDVIANNIANVNTIGFKSDTTFFADVLSSSLSGGSAGTLQVGRGVAVADVQTQFGSGSFETTGNATDAAIDGDGFFMVNDAEGGTFYTRAGSFHMNSDGVLVDINGYKLQGQMVVNGQNQALSDIQLQGVQSQPAVTTTISLGANLNSSTSTGGQYNTTQTVYDSLGASHTLNTTFTKTANSTQGMWGLEISLDSNPVPSTDISALGFVFDTDGTLTSMYTGTVGAVTSSGAGTATAALDRPGMVYQTGALTLTRGATAAVWTVASTQYPNAQISNVDTTAGTVSVSLDGTGTSDVTLTLAGTWASGNTAAFTVTNAPMGLADINMDLSSIALNGGATIGNGGNVTWDLVGSDALDITQYATTSVIRAVSSDGYASGQLKSLSIDQNGMISGFFTNGQTAELAQIVLASFANPWGLNKLGSNLFGETVTSGSSIRNTPGSSGMGSLTPNTVEMSNTDIATEFIRMITAQKAYQANAKVVTTQDNVMSTLMQIMQ